MSKAAVMNNVPQTSQDIGETVHNTASDDVHKKSYEIADEIVRKHDKHQWNSDLGRRVHNTASVGENHGWHDGRDEGQPVEKKQ